MARMMLPVDMAKGAPMTRVEWRYSRTLCALIPAAVLASGGCIVGEGPDPSFDIKKNGARTETGFGDTFFSDGALDPNNEFFQSLGTNNRTCGSCHVQSEGWSITPEGVAARFDASGGADPIFRLNDGSNSPTADVSTPSKLRAAYSMLLTKGLIRVGIGIPAGADFRLVDVQDPYGYASATELSLFRRPLPTTNLPFLATVMWDGRETLDPADLSRNLTQQAHDATLGHAQATGADGVQMASIVSLETGLFSAQTVDDQAEALDANGGGGGPELLAGQDFYIGINDVLGADPTGKAFDPKVFTLFDAWIPPANPSTNAHWRRRYQIARGQILFNTKPIAIRGVKGLNDVLGIDTIMGTCTTCHDSPNVGNHSVPLPIDIGIADASRRTSDMPLYTLERISDGARISTTDPGRALITGRFADIGKFKGPILRGLSMRAPYFHNGSARKLSDVVSFYETRFGVVLTPQEESDLVAFLQAL